MLPCPPRRFRPIATALLVVLALAPAAFAQPATAAPNEVPLPQDCPLATTVGDAEACCASGKLQGCSMLGVQLALNNQWAQASTHFLRVCQARVREGCENLITAFEQGSGVNAHTMLHRICQEAYPKGNHVACELLETQDWGRVHANASVMKMLQAPSDAGEATAPPATPTPTQK